MSELREVCQHRWVDILQHFGMTPEFLSKRHGPCPLCGGRDRGRFTDYEGTGAYICNQCAPDSIDGIEFLIRHTGQSFKALAADIRSIIGDTSARPAPEVDTEKARLRLRKIWGESKPLSKGCPTHLYLLNRGLAGLEFGKIENLRCHPGMTYWYREGNEKPVSLGNHPTMIGLVTTPDNQPATIHCTYLTKDGRKAALDPVKKIMPVARSYQGGAIRLQKLEEGQTLCIAEGIETTLALKLMYPDVCPWAVMSEGNMQKFTPPNHNSSTIYIAGDNDESYAGQAAAFALAKRLSGKHKAEVLLPEQMGTDFLDEYNNQSRARSA